ncbi:MAG: exodeoxyribonuclease VII small subunit [Proteobacteria bacterium]|jgi:exodeoxyribonuclease VII small subunit|nr:exodeoxyribonuclease VII small subunit [Candidatus Fonsibacter sp. PEL4]NBZ97376.1 exodeoxyribonuclease VII small subunit [Candidatus Fonsibacter sp. PEL4]
MKKSNISPDITKLSFEEALEQLEDIVSKLEDGSINLEESIEEYTRGVHLKNHCETKLKEATLKVEQITIDKDGKFSTKEFNKNS